MTLAVRYGVEMDLYPWFMDRLEIDIVQHLDLSDQVLNQSCFGKTRDENRLMPDTRDVPI